MENCEFKDLTFGFMGGGNMAKAISEGMVRQGLSEYSKMFAAGPRLNNLTHFVDRGARVTTENGKMAEEVDVVFLSVKPQILPEAIANMYETSTKISGKLFISILAGVTIDSIENVLSRCDGARVVRVMPNTPLMVGYGCSAYCPGQQATNEDINIVRKIFEASGICQLLPESMINAFCGLAGSGPAYIYTVIEALSDGAVKMGIPREMATKFAAQTVLGASKMVLETEKHTGSLKDDVCSPMGTTIYAIHVLEKQGIRAAFIDAVEAATSRGVELSNKPKESKQQKGSKKSAAN